MPLTGDWKVFSTQVLREPFAIGSGVPKLHPVVLQSGAAVLTAGAVVNGVMLQAEPEQLRSKRLCEPSGVGPSGTSELPPPNSRVIDLKLIPYYAWGNRGKSEMTVWLPLAN